MTPSSSTSVWSAGDRPLRVALVAPPWLPVPPRGYGGTERVVSLLAEGLVAAGHDVTLYAAPGSRTSARLVTPLEEPTPFLGGAIDDDIVHGLTVYEHREQFDLVHDHTVLGPAFGALAGDHPPTVHTLHGAWKPAVRRKFELLHDRVHLVAISDAQRRENPHVRYSGLVYNGIELDAHPIRHQKESFLLFVGRMSREKDPETAIRVARAAGLPLKIITKRLERVEHEYWDRTIAPLVDDSVQILEHVPEEVKLHLMSRARALLAPINWSEPFGLVLTEAMACGTPVIARPLGAAPEIVVDGVTGFLCDTDDEMVAAAAAVGEIAPDACRDRVARCFSAEAMVAGYERVYRRVLRW